MSKACKLLHELTLKRERFSSGFSLNGLPTKNGIYLVFEKGETAHSDERLVRVGTHNSDDRLEERIFEHLYKPNKNSSIFRKHVGRCLLSDSPFLEYWNSTKKHQNMSDVDKQKSIEDDVTKYMQENFSFTVFEVATEKERRSIEKGLLATLTQCDECSPSKDWLGQHHQNPIIRQGLWNVQGLKGTPYTEIEIEKIAEKYF